MLELFAILVVGVAFGLFGLMLWLMWFFKDTMK